VTDSITENANSDILSAQQSVLFLVEGRLTRFSTLSGVLHALLISHSLNP
jgi:hypothetical protein